MRVTGEAAEDGAVQRPAAGGPEQDRDNCSLCL